MGDALGSYCEFSAPLKNEQMDEGMLSCKSSNEYAWWRNIYDTAWSIYRRFLTCIRAYEGIKYL